MPSLYEYRLRRIRVSRASEHLGLEPLLAPKQIAHFFRSRLMHHDREQFFVGHTDAHAVLVAYELTAIGTMSSVDIHPREAFRAAILAGASGIILAHNHPSNSITPSEDDDHLTRRMVAAGELLGIPVLDHVIVADRGYYSYFENNRIKEPP